MLRQAEDWADTLVAHTSPEGYRHSVFPAAVEAWAEFGSIDVKLDGAGWQLARTSFAIDPLRGLHQPRTLSDVGRALNLPVAPLGEEADGQALLVIDTLGRVHSLDHTGEWFLGHTLDQALTTLITGAVPQRLGLPARPGAAPAPRPAPDAAEAPASGPSAADSPGTQIPGR
jgi:SUKH-3 immunity protein